jgi:hypothetical protein
MRRRLSREVSVNSRYREVAEESCCGEAVVEPGLARVLNKLCVRHKACSPPDDCATVAIANTHSAVPSLGLATSKPRDSPLKWTLEGSMAKK